MALHGLHERQQTVGVFNDATMILEAKHDPRPPRMLRALLESRDTRAAGHFEGAPRRHRSGEHPKMRSRQRRSVVDPGFHGGDLRVKRRAARRCERVADSRTTDGDASQERMPPQRSKGSVIGSWREEVAREFGGITATIGGKVDK
jgi:hypothetical protein